MTNLSNLTNLSNMKSAREGYYVGLDPESAMGPQTFLVYHQNGQPLKDCRGVLPWLVIPAKYHVQNMMRIDLIYL